MSFPADFTHRMTAQLGAEAPDFFQALTGVPPVSIRLNPFKPSQRFQQDVPVTWCAQGRYLSERPSFTRDPFFHAGCYYVQEASSMYVEMIVREHVDVSGVRFALDLCAAPGGKSTHLRSLLPSQSLLVCNEVVPQRNFILCENLVKWGHPGIVVTRNDPEDFTQYANYFDLILVDAPCSGEGMFRKDPTAVKEWSQANVSLCAARQSTILESALAALSPGGILIYSTCTWSEDEDEQQVKRWLDEGLVEVLSLPVFDGIERNDYGARFYPHRVKGEGFFISAMRKKASTDSILNTQRRKSKPSKQKPFVLSEDQKYLAGDFFYQRQGDDVWAMPTHFKDLLEDLQAGLRVVYSGCKIGTFKGKELLPSPEIAWSIHRKNSLPFIPLDLSLALQYLRGEALPVDPYLKGWMLLVYEGYSLGWGKAVNGRLNNAYPKEWRIRMDVNR